VTKIDGKDPMAFGDILNIKEVSDYLKIPVSTIYKLIQERKLPAIKLGKHWRLMKKDIDGLFTRTPQLNSGGGPDEKRGSPKANSGDGPRGPFPLEANSDPAD
jgi:excisionase family DNA binding protein